MTLLSISRPCYDKPHRCPGWAGGGWRYPQTDRCNNGYIRLWRDADRDPKLRNTFGRYWSFPRRSNWRFGHCDKCNLTTWPFAPYAGSIRLTGRCCCDRASTCVALSEPVPLNEAARHDPTSPSLRARHRSHHHLLRPLGSSRRTQKARQGTGGKGMSLDFEFRLAASQDRRCDRYQDVVCNACGDPDEHQDWCPVWRRMVTEAAEQEARR